MTDDFIKNIFIISAVILIPSWSVAYITDKVVYVIPMLAVCTFILAQLFKDEHKRLDEDPTDVGKKDE